MFFAPVVRTRSVSPFRSFDRSFERFVNDTFFGAPASVQREEKGDDKSAAKDEAKQTKSNTWTITLDVPGISREDLVINIEDNFVSLKTRAEARRQCQVAYGLPAEIDAETSSAKLENGVLTLTLGKKAPVSNARQLEVR